MKNTKEIRVDGTTVKIKKPIFTAIADYSALFVLILMLISGCIYSFIYLYPFDIAEIHSPYKVLTPIVKAGENLKYQANSEKKLNFPADVACYFEDGVVYKLPERYSDNRVGVNTSILEITVPSTLQPSKYRLHCEINYKIGNIRTIQYEYFTEYFQVVK